MRPRIIVKGVRVASTRLTVTKEAIIFQKKQRRVVEIFRKIFR